MLGMNNFESGHNFKLIEFKN